MISDEELTGVEGENGGPNGKICVAGELSKEEKPARGRKKYGKSINIGKKRIESN